MDVRDFGLELRDGQLVRRPDAPRGQVETMRQLIERSRAMDPFSMPHSARALADMHDQQNRLASRLAAAQAERDDLQRQQVELLASIVEAVDAMHSEADAASHRSEARFKQAHNLQLAILGLGVLAVVVALATLVVAA